MKIGGYTLDLYCDNLAEKHWIDPNHPYGSMPLTYTGETRQECNKKARKDGWKLSEETDLCPVCSKKNPDFFKRR